MKTQVKFNNLWIGRIHKDSGYLTGFDLSWQFDEYYKGITIVILNFQFRIGRY